MSRQQRNVGYAAPVMESLEPRQLMSATIPDAIYGGSAGGQIFNYTEVGFRNNPLAAFHGTVEGRLDVNPAHYIVRVDWGDGAGWSQTDLKVGLTYSGNDLLLKGTHVYNKRGDYSIRVEVSSLLVKRSFKGPAATVRDMPDAASLPVSKPANVGARKPLGEVTMAVTSANVINAKAGQKLSNVALGTLAGQYKLQWDTNASDYLLQINWGDSGSWTTGVTLGPASKLPDVKMRLFGSHTYATPGRHTIVLYITGPDGQTISKQGPTVVVK